MADEHALDAVVEHVRPFTHVLSALRLSKKQLVRVGVSDRGVTFVAVDDSKSLQAQANFRAETFAAFSANPAAAFLTRDRSARAAISSSASFDVSLGALIDALNVFAPLDGETTVSLRWPDRDGKLVLAAAAERDGARPSDTPVRSVTHASISPQDDASTRTNAELVFRGERNAFMVPTTTLKTIVDDLEWPSGGSSGSAGAAGVATVAMANEPRGGSLTFTARSPETGALCVAVDVPNDDASAESSRGKSCLSEYVCDAPGSWRYRVRSLRAATAVPAHLLVAPHRGWDGDGPRPHHDAPGGALDGPTTTRVAIGEGGMLKVVHLVRLARSAAGVAGGGAAGATGATTGTRGHEHLGSGSENPAFSFSARGIGARGSVVVPITFVAYPEEEEEEEEDG